METYLGEIGAHEKHGKEGFDARVEQDQQEGIVVSHQDKNDLAQSVKPGICFYLRLFIFISIPYILSS